MTLTLTVPGEPCAKARPRVTKQGIAFTPAKTKNYENLVKELFIITYGQTFVPLDCPLSSTVSSFHSIPRSWSNKKKKLASEGQIRPSKKPDLDNLAKSVWDSLNGLAYKDDSQIVEAKIEKWYSARPRVEIEITEIK